MPTTLNPASAKEPVASSPPGSHADHHDIDIPVIIIVVVTHWRNQYCDSGHTVMASDHVVEWQLRPLPIGRQAPPCGTIGKRRFGRVLRRCGHED